MKIYNNEANSVYDNMYSKPPQISKESNFSVLVLFKVELANKPPYSVSQFINGGIFSGQYNYDTSRWNVHGLRDDFIRECEHFLPLHKEDKKKA